MNTFLQNFTFQENKPSKFFFILIMFFAYSFIPINAQEGYTCYYPIVVSDLPFEDSGINSNYGNNYDSDDVPEISDDAVTDGSSSPNYLNGYDVVYAFTPIENGSVDISITFDGNRVGLWAFTGCPFSLTVGYHNGLSGNTRSINDLPVLEGETYYIVISDRNSNPVDYNIEITGDVELVEQEECTEVDAGVINGDNNVCPGVDFNLIADGASLEEGGVEGQWQSSVDGNEWENIEDEIFSSLTTSIQEDTYFRFTLTCTESGETDVSDEFEVTIIDDPLECYCIPAGNESGNNRNISRFQLEDIDNETGSPSDSGYSDFADIETDLFENTEYTAVVTTGGSGTGAYKIAIWIDYNNDGEFSENELVVSEDATPGEDNDVTFTVPTEVNGSHRLRVLYVFSGGGGIVDPCDPDNPYFEVEDYTVNILIPETCVDADAGTIIGEDHICADTEFTLIADGASSGESELQGQWQLKVEGNEWEDIEDETSALLTTSIDEDTYYRFIMTCVETSDSDISDEFQVTVNDPLECYCTPESSCFSTANLITNVTLEGESETIDNDSGCSGDGYGNYTDLIPADITAGETYTLNVSTTDPSTVYLNLKAWIDYNKNGVFDEDEEIATTEFDGFDDSGTGEFEFTVPEDVDFGNTRLRVRMVGSNVDDFGPCSVENYGEAEDYMVEIIEGEEPCQNPTELEIENITATSAEVSWTSGGDEDQWEFIYAEGSFDPENEEGEIVGETNRSLTNLEPDTEYQISVRALCDDDNSDWISESFMTEEESCEDPTSLVVNEITESSAEVSWNPGGGEDQWEFIYAEGSFDPENEEGEIVGETNRLLTDLEPDTEYQVAVRALCDNSNSNWISESFTTLEEETCEAPTNLEVEQITNTSAQVSWNPGGEEEQWEVRYGETGFEIETDGQSLMVEGNPETILTDLDENTEYDIYVRAICDEETNFASDWTGPVIFLDVDKYNFKEFTFYPNPVKNRLYFEAGKTIEKIKVFNLLGQQVINLQPNTHKTELNVDGWQTGVYLMQVFINGNSKYFRIVKK